MAQVNASGHLTIGPLGSVAAPRLAVSAAELSNYGKVQATASISADCPAYVIACPSNATNSDECAYPLTLDVSCRPRTPCPPTPCTSHAVHC